MTDLVITVAQVLPGTSSDAISPSFEDGIAAVAVTAGQPVYLNASGLYALADADLSAAAAAAHGIALHAALAGQPLRVQIGGDVTLGAGAGPVVGTLYVASATAGGISPASALGAGLYTTVLGVGITGNKLRLRPWATGQVAP